MGRIGWSDFVIWQCSLRQRNFRMFGGKPSEGTIASFSNIKSDIQLGDIRSILMEDNCKDTSKMIDWRQSSYYAMLSNDNNRSFYWSKRSWF